MEVAVVDASVVIKWFVEEPYSDKALQLREDFVEQKINLVVPYLLRYEVLNALKYSGGFGAKELVKIAAILDDYQFFEMHISGVYAEETVRISTDYGLTIYDSCYAAIGKVRRLRVFTADDKLLTKVRDIDFIKHIADYDHHLKS